MIKQIMAEISKQKESDESIVKVWPHLASIFSQLGQIWWNELVFSNYNIFQYYTWIWILYCYYISNVMDVLTC